MHGSRGTVPTEGVQKLIDLPQFLQNLPKPETLEVLLNRFRSKVAEPTADVSIPQDLENENLKEFMARMVEKVWPKPATSTEISQKSTTP